MNKDLKGCDIRQHQNPILSRVVLPSTVTRRGHHRDPVTTFVGEQSIVCPNKRPLRWHPMAWKRFGANLQMAQSGNQASVQNRAKAPSPI